MTFHELNKKLGGNEQQSEWTQHRCGGWYHKSAKVAETCKIHENAIVWGILSGNARVYGDARVYGNAQVYGDAQVYGNAQVYGDAQVYGNAQVYGDAQVSGDARVYGDAQVYGDAWVKSPLFIIGSRHSLTNAKKGHIAIGCMCMPFKWWSTKEAEKFARENGYTDEDIKEYRHYIALFKKVGK